MSALKVNGALFEQFASYSVMRVERSIDRLYADLRAAGVRLPEIVGPVFEVSGYQVGGQDAQCFVSPRRTIPIATPSRSADRPSGRIPTGALPRTAALSTFTTRTR
jgi:hypothetical protein